MLTANVTWYRSKNSPVVHVKQKSTKTWAFGPHVLQPQGHRIKFTRRHCPTPGFTGIVFCVFLLQKTVRCKLYILEF